ncbi:L-threonylcarbamoyladenylate synthase [Anditalea andensis]|uniref:Threonylcarbamoyl-AMP synthase n=1 Tax=Anditalea andensis TaxID=1048983 RepID=A0A074LMM3_9BACT|nr:L-threonylcarbamoyladenylate synthase [Anditalea andensis]KEO75117.1 translation factor (SUA5) [Anditalea andensis]
MAEIGKDIAKAKAILEAGGLVGIPTETVYGLAANALDAEAVAKIFEVKNRPEFDPLIIHVSSMQQVVKYTEGIHPILESLGTIFWPGPLTLLLPRKSIIPDLVTSGLDHVAVRVPQHPLTLGLLANLDFPLAAPSANPFGYISPTTAAHVDDQLGDMIPYVLDGGNSEVGLESTIIGLEEEQITIYRLGGVDVGDIEKIVGPVTIMSHSSSNPKSPGMLKSHYAPRKKVILGDIAKNLGVYKNEKIGILSFTSQYTGGQESFVLSERGSYAEAAKNLFTALRFLDQADVSLILAELLPEENLGRAINDRLRRASVK